MMARKYTFNQLIIYIISAMSSFNKLGLSNWILSTCEKIKYNTPTPIQSLTIPQILKGKSVIINSETGSGKTAAFGLPLLHELSKDPTSIFAVIIAPSLQLAMQIHQQMNIFGQGINLRQALIVGGVNYRMQYEQLQKYPHIVIATPGRLAELIDKSQKLVEELKRVEVLVLDQADRLFQEHLLPNMQRIIQAMPSLRQALLATATIDENFQGKRLQKLLNIKLQFSKYSTFEGKKTVSTLIQNYIFTNQQLKPGSLMDILERNPRHKVIVFVKSCKECTLICQTLQKLEVKATQLHSFMKNSQRVANLATFKSSAANVLVTTDLTSRGLDIADVNLVINYHLPRTVADYIHRVGRTARRGLEGEAITFVTPNEVQVFQNIENQIGVKMQPHQLNQKPNLELNSRFSKAKREVRIHLMSCGVLDQLQRRKKRKLEMRQQNS